MLIRDAFFGASPLNLEPLRQLSKRSHSVPAMVVRAWTRPTRFVPSMNVLMEPEVAAIARLQAVEGASARRGCVGLR